jgi:hypothetical protein
MSDKKDYEMEFEFPDEKESKTAATQQESKGKPEEDEGVEIIDDTPPEDRDPITGKAREPLPPKLLEEIEQDELEEYSERAKARLKQMRRVWHDERRAKESATREREEAVAFAQRILEENRRLKSTLSEGEKTYIDTAKGAADLELEMAKRAYKEAYESGDADRIVEAQEKMSQASFKVNRISNYRPSLQQEEIDVNSQLEQQIQVPRPDQRTVEWQEKNSWFGTDEEMTSLALGLHQKLEKSYGKGFVGTDEYWTRVDKTMRQRFPEYFGEESVSVEKTTNGGGRPVERRETKPATVVAPASRSTSSKKIVLTQREANIAKRLNLTPEQYAREKMRLENTNG